jgi:SAM-dependent methyltransferase
MHAAELDEEEYVVADDYVREQKHFWNVDEHTARFGRVDTVSRSEEEYERLANRDIGLVLEGIDPQTDWTILEIGCGVGRLLKRLISRARPGKAIGVDIAEKMIQYARIALKDLGHVELMVNTGADAIGFID